MNFLKILAHNIASNGAGALVYSYGLSSARYIEYSTVLKLLQNENVTSILDVGSGHSLMPTLLAKKGYRVSLVDLNEDSIAWQRARMSRYHDLAEAKVASALELPFEDGSLPAVTCISVLEHIRDGGDIKAVAEIARVLQDNGLCIISTGVSPEEKCADWLRGIPPWIRLILGEERLKKLLKSFNTDRSETYYERFYPVEEVAQRFTQSGLIVESQEIHWDWPGNRVIYKLVPMGSVTLLEYALAHTFSGSAGRKDNIGTIILKLRKASPPRG